MYCKVIFIHPVPTNKKKKGNKIKLDENENFKNFLFNKKTIDFPEERCVCFFSVVLQGKNVVGRCTKQHQRKVESVSSPEI